MRRFLVVANRNAGSADQEVLAAGVAVLERSASVEVCATGDVGELDAVLARLEGRTLVVAGGDGSLHLAVGRGAPSPIGLLPLGTGNDLARGLGYPRDPAAAAERILSGAPRPLDLLRTDFGEVVVNASHAGLGAVAAATSEDLKSRLGALAYPVGALISGVREGGYHLRVEVDGTLVSEGETLLVGIGNGPSIGGGTLLVPPAVPDDGLLDVVVVQAVGPLARTAFATALSAGTHLDRDDVLHVRGHTTTITGDPVPHDLDGEVTAPLPTATYTLDPQAWTLLGG